MKAKTKAGFTLLELLVVVAIVAIVAALLMSALRRGRAVGDAGQCINNLRVLAEANLRYAAENGGQYCFAMTRNNKIRWHGERAATAEAFDPKKGPLAPYLGREGRVKICPAFSEMLGGAESFEEGSGGYGYNAVYIGGAPGNKWEGERISNVDRPGATIMFADTAFPREKGIQEYPFAEPWQWVSASGKLAGPLAPSVHFRHSGHAHIAWCDGHVTPEKPSTLGSGNLYGGDSAKHQIGWIGPSAENGLWNPRRETPESSPTPE